MAKRDLTGKKKWAIFSGPDWFRPSVTSTRQIMYQYHKKGYNILWVNPIAFKSPAVNSSTRKSMKIKILNKLKTHLKFFRKVEKGIYVLIPVYLPIFSSFGDKLNAALIRFQIFVISILLGIKTRETILWISGNFTLSPLLNRPFYSKVYQAADLISDFRTNDPGLRKKLYEKELHLSTHVDFLFASSPNIREKLEKLSGRQVTLLTHGVNYTHFDTPQKASPLMDELKSAGRPIAGYFGTLSDANDKEVFRILAENGFSVVVIGKILGDYSSLKGINNIYFTGPVDYNNLPSFAQYFDICLLNWIMADWIYNSFPVKTLEYLAMGKPIVSCPIPVVMDMFAPLVYFASTPEEYLEKVRIALKEDNKELSLLRKQAAAGHTWENKFKIIESAIQ